METLAWASALAPHNLFYREILKRLLNEWHEALETVKPPGFPPLSIRYPPRRFPAGMPVDLERNIIGLTVTEFLLKDPINVRKWWEPMRRGVALPAKISRIDVIGTLTGYDVRCTILPTGI